MLRGSLFKKLLVIVMVVMCFVAPCSKAVYAETLDDGISTTDSLSGGSISEDDIAVGEIIKNNRGMTSEQLSTASETLSPITDLFGYLVGGIISVVMAGIFVITALDIMYLSIPPVRGLLYTQGGNTNGTVTPSRQWISDEALMVSQAAGYSGGNSGANANGGMQGQYGMMGRAGMQNNNTQQQKQVSTKSVLSAYFMKRMFFLILLAICIIILTSSVLLGTGVNLARWGIKIIDMLNGYIPS